MDASGKSLDAFGLIHADLSIGGYGNVLHHKGMVCPIDFDDCGYGYWVYDLATTLAHWQTHPRWVAYRAALLEGYGQVRPLPAQMAELGLFMAARHVSEILWGIDQAQTHAGFRQELDDWIEWAGQHVARYLEKGESL
jgi:Ser/Thr protein kinase RdoA (MazF antagonist)